MKLLNFYRKHRKLSILLFRLKDVIKRYGFSQSKFEKGLKSYIRILREHNVTATFPITATVLKKNGKLIRQLSGPHVEFAVHGCKHIDYSQLSYDQQVEHFDEAINIFEEEDIEFNGFRCPYLRYNDGTMKALEKYNFAWESSDVIYWDVLEDDRFNHQNTYQTILSQYNIKPSSQYLSLPKVRNGFIEIPVSLPDDDLLTDRLRTTDEFLPIQVWERILHQTHLRGELFTLQLHPERIFFLRDTLQSLVEEANNAKPAIWITTLKEIALWWREKESFKAEINEKGNGEYEVRAHCSERAAILIKVKDSEGDNFVKNYKVEDKRHFKVHGGKRPVIGVSPNCPPELLQFLRNEGFVYEVIANKQDHVIHLKDMDSFCEKDEMNLLARLQQIHEPFIKFWRWPKGYRSALAITGDIDGITYFDFFGRYFG